MDASVPNLETRKAVSKWRLDLFYTHWGERQTRILEPVLVRYGIPTGRLHSDSMRQYVKRRWLVAKTRALVESDRLLMPDGPGALNRVEYKDSDHVGPR